MDFVKVCCRAMQDSHEVDHRIVPRQQSGQLRRIMHIGLNHRDHGEHLHRTSGQVTGGHRDVQACAVERFTHMAADKAAST